MSKNQVRRPPCIDCGSTEFYARERCHSCYDRLRKQMRCGGQWVRLVGEGTALERLMAEARTSSQGCILYGGTIMNRGYGQICLGGRQMLAHRAAYELLIGPIPDGLVIDHRCHNQDLGCRGGDNCPHRRCINVEHLEPVTLAENTRRGHASWINARKTHCPSGHPYDEANTHWYDGRRYCRACNNAIRRKKPA